MGNWEKNVRTVVPYTPGEQPKETGIIKLNTNENPYPPSPGVAKALAELPADLMRRYPDPAVSLLTKGLAERYGVAEEQVFVGVGSDDVLALCFLTYFNAKDKPVLFPDITYSFYDVWAELYRIPYERQPLDDAFRIRKEDYFKENGGIIFPNPNAPTGRGMPLSDIEEIVRRNPDSVVIVDEAYVDFGAESALGLTAVYDNLLVVQTFSKSRSLAGMRIGYAIGCARLIKYLSDVKYSFNSYTMNQAAIAAGAAVLAEDAYYRECCRKIMEVRGESEKEFARLGFRFFPSDSNFLFVTHPEKPAKEIFEALRARKIYVRYFNKERISEYLRVTIGTREEMAVLFGALEEILAS